MPIPISLIIAGVIKYGPTAISFFETGIEIGKKLAEGKGEMSDDEWAALVARGDQVGQDLRELVGRE